MNDLTYHIKVRGRIPEAWLDAFLDLEIAVSEQAGIIITCISGRFSDPAALQGILNNLYMLGLTLISVECQDSGHFAK